MEDASADNGKDLRAIYAADTLEEAASALDRFEASWGDKCLVIGPSWRADWDRLTALFDFPPAIRYSRKFDLSRRTRREVTHDHKKNPLFDFYGTSSTHVHRLRL